MGLGEVWVRRWSLGWGDSAICGDLRPWCFSCSGLPSVDPVRLVCYFSVPAADRQVSAAAASGGQWTCLSRLFLLLTCNLGKCGFLVCLVVLACCVLAVTVEKKKERKKRRSNLKPEMKVLSFKRNGVCLRPMPRDPTASQLP